MAVVMHLRHMSYSSVVVLAGLALGFGYANGCQAEDIKTPASPKAGEPLTETTLRSKAQMLSPAADVPTQPVAQTPQLDSVLSGGNDTGRPIPKITFKPGNALSIDAGFEDIVCTNNVTLAKQQRDNFAESAEASFIYAVALSRTCAVEDALKEVRRARRLAEKEGGPVYFDKMIASYEKMLESYPDDNQVRYHLAWAYYMKAYVLAKYSTPKNGQAVHPAYKAWVDEAKKEAKEEESGKENSEAANNTKDGAPAKTAVAPASLPHIKRTIEGVAPEVVPQIQKYYALAMQKLDQVLAANPTDVWSRIYRAHLAYEASGDMSSSLKEWTLARDQNPMNPAPYFFLGEGFLKQGNLKECMLNVSKAIALRTENKPQETQVTTDKTQVTTDKTQLTSDKTQTKTDAGAK